jgi:hypothetical protein
MCGVVAIGRSSLGAHTSLDPSALLRYHATVVEIPIELDQRFSITLGSQPHGSGPSARLSNIKVPLPAQPWVTQCTEAEFGSTSQLDDSRRIAGVLSKLNKVGLLSMESKITISFSVAVLLESNGVTLFTWVFYHKQ